MKNLNAIIIIFICSFISLISNDTLRTRVGGYVGAGVSSHTADFYKLYGIPNCCPAFEDGTGLIYHFGGLFEYPLFEDILIGGRFSYQSIDGKLIKTEPTTLISNGELTAGEFEHEMVGNFSTLSIDPYLSYSLIDNLFLTVGVRLGMNLSATYDQKEEITKPEGVGTFVDSIGNDTHSRIRNDLSGDIPKASNLNMFAFTGISYELPLNSSGDLLLIPELMFYSGLTEMVENTSWIANNIIGNIAIKYQFMAEPEIKEEYKYKFEIDTIRKESDIIASEKIVQGQSIFECEAIKSGNSITYLETTYRIDTLLYPKNYRIESQVIAVGIDENGNEIANPIFKVEEFESSRLEPLLNYIFFEDSFSELQGKYNTLTKSEIIDFSIDNLYYASTLDIYYDILNIVGYRMEENPDAKITLVGCNAGIGEEKDDKGLSLKRAENVKNYIVEIWGISSDRIIIESRNLPEKASTPINEPIKSAENRRVEIYSSYHKIIEPVYIEHVLRKANPPIARFVPMAEAEAGLNEWIFTAYQFQSGQDEYIVSGKDKMPQYIDWELEFDQSKTPDKPMPIMYSLQVKDNKGNSDIIENKTLPIDLLTVKEKRINKIGDYELQKYSLILFEFDKATIEGRNKRIIDFIKSKIRDDSEIEILGYTDKTGDADYNKKLATLRANSTSNILKRNDAEVKGIGEEKLLYNNDIPEGRFYCRTVVINIKTKID